MTERYGRGNPIPDEQVVELTREGMSAAQIAERFGCTARSVQRARARAGITKQARQPYSAEVRAQAAQMLDDGASCAEVARTLGVFYQTVRRAWFPGRAWTKSQVWEHNSALRQFGQVLK